MSSGASLSAGGRRVKHLECCVLLVSAELRVVLRPHLIDAGSFNRVLPIRHLHSVLRAPRELFIHAARFKLETLAEVPVEIFELPGLRVGFALSMGEALEVFSLEYD